MAREAREYRIPRPMASPANDLQEKPSQEGLKRVIVKMLFEAAPLGKDLHLLTRKELKKPVNDA
jgi:hypothetical protein